MCSWPTTSSVEWSGGDGEWGACLGARTRVEWSGGAGSGGKGAAQTGREVRI